MPAASCRTRPARSISLWLRASASAGSSRSVGTSDVLSRMGMGPSRPPARSMRVGRLVRSLDARVVDQALDGLAAHDVRLEDLLEIRILHTRVPDVVGIDDDHRAVTTLREAARLVDPDVRLEASPQRL